MLSLLARKAKDKKNLGLPPVSRRCERNGQTPVAPGTSARRFPCGRLGTLLAKPGVGSGGRQQFRRRADAGRSRLWCARSSCLSDFDFGTRRALRQMSFRRGRRGWPLRRALAGCNRCSLRSSGAACSRPSVSRNTDFHGEARHPQLLSSLFRAGGGPYGEVTVKRRARKRKLVVQGEAKEILDALVAVRSMSHVFTPPVIAPGRFRTGRSRTRWDGCAAGSSPIPFRGCMRCATRL
jgi:hypothetical protein